MPIDQLTAEQEKLISSYQEKWRQIAISTEPINRQQATLAVNQIYALAEKKAPKSRFFSSPNAVKLEFLNQPPLQLAQELGSSMGKMPLAWELLGEVHQQIDEKIWQQLNQKLQPTVEPIQLLIQQLMGQLSEEEMQQLGQFWQQLSEQQWDHLWEQQQEWMRAQIRQLPGGDLLLWVGDSVWKNMGEPLWQEVGEPIVEEISQQSWVRQWEETLKQFSAPWLQVGSSLGLMSSLFNSSLETAYVSLLDFCISVLDCEHDRQKWSALQSLVEDCGWVFMFENTCWLCERPTKILADSQHRLHGEGESAIHYADGYCLYAHHGVILPEKYGRVHPHQWQAQWLLTEKNAELRRVLIQGIGYGRICQELQAVELDTWREYTLLEISQDVDVEKIYLLKMTCSSTGHIHALRVPPHLRSAREAIRWVNWGIDSENFSVQT